MTQNVISIAFSDADLAAIDGALATLEEKFAALISLSTDEKRALSKMGTRAEIFSIHLQRRNRNPAGIDVATLAKATEGFSGAEIEYCVIEALFDAFHQNREPNTEDFLRATKVVVPLSVTYAEELQRLRAWAKTRARMASRSKTQQAA